MAQVWPVTLPQKPLYAGNQETLPNNVISFSTEGGPAKRRKRYTAKGGTFPMTFKMTAAQLATYRTFYNDTIEQGALAFELEHPTREDTAYWIITESAITRVGASPADFYLVACQMIEQPYGDPGP